MFLFFTVRRWLLWAWLGSAVILGSIIARVKIDVKINEWFGGFYDLIQEALAEPNSISATEYWGFLITFGWLATLWISLGLAVGFLTAHFLFRWRTAMVEWYHEVYDLARTIEGASQRVQEDTIKFSRIVQVLGVSLFESVLLLVEFLPILLGLGMGLTILWFGEWKYGLVAGALIWAAGGTLFLVFVAFVLRLVGIEYDLQKQEAAYRKMLVIAEDDGTVRPKRLDELFVDVRKIHFLSYLRYLYFDCARLAYLQANVLSAYVFLAPAIIAGAITLGVMQQIIRAFGRVESSMQYLLVNWQTFVELASVYKRLREFERQIKEKQASDGLKPAE